MRGRVSEEDWSKASAMKAADPALSYSEIGKMLGVSKQAVQKRFGAGAHKQVRKKRDRSGAVVLVDCSAKRSPDDWQAAREAWEQESTLSFGDIAAALGVTKQAVQKRAARDMWVRQGSVPRPIVTKAAPIESGIDAAIRRRASANASAARNRARRIGALPAWSEEELILQIYIEAARREKQVDHILPLNGEFVCGLHVHANLQLLDPIPNARKNNSFSAVDYELRLAYEAAS